MEKCLIKPIQKTEKENVNLATQVNLTTLLQAGH